MGCIVVEVFLACCSLAYEVIVAGCDCWRLGYLNLKTVEECLKVINQCSAISTCHRTDKTSKQCVELIEFVGIVAVLLAKNLNFLILVDTLDKALETDA